MPTSIALLLAALPTPAQATRPPAEVRKLSGPLAVGALPGWAGAARLSPDGTRVLFLQRVDQAEALHVAPVDASAPALELDSGTPVLPRWTGDGTRIVYGSRPAEALVGIFSVPADGGAAPTRLVALGNGVTVPSWPPTSGPDLSVAVSADSAFVAFRATLNGVTQLYGVPVGGGTPVRLNATLASGGDVTALVGSPAGLEVVYVADQDVDERFELYAVPADGSAAPRLLSGTLPAGESVWTFSPYEPSLDPSGARVLYHTWNPASTFTGFHGAPLDASAAPVELETSTVDYAVTPDGADVVYRSFASDRRQHLYRVPSDGSAAPQILASVASGVLQLFRLSPDGQRALFLNSGGTSELGSVRLDGTGLVTLLGHSVSAFVPPSFSADSARIGFLESSVGLFALPSDGSQPPALVADLPWPVGCEQFELTADQLVFRADLEGPDQLYRAPLAALAPPVVLNDPLAPGQSVQRFLTTPDGALVLAEYAQLADTSVPLTRSALEGAPDVLALNAPYPLGVVGDVEAFTVRRGQVVYRADQDTPRVQELYGGTLAPGDAPVKLSGALVAEGDVQEFALTQDGRRVVFVADAELDGKDELYAAPSDGSAAPVKLSALPDDVDVVAFVLSPDGSRVVYEDSRINSRIYSVGLDGAGALQLAFGDGPLRVSPDSAHVLFHPLSSVSLGSVPLLGGTPQDLDGGRSVEEYRLSADGARVVYLAHGADGLRRLFSVPTAGGAPGQLHPTPVTDGEAVQFALCGNRVVFRADLFTNERFLCLSVPVDGSAAPTVLSGPLAAGGDVRDLAVDPAGTRVVYLADQEANGDYGLYSVPVAGGASAQRILDASEFLRFRQIQDGRRVLFESESALLSLPTLGGPTTLAAELGLLARYELTSDELRVVFADLDGLHSAPLAGGAKTTLATPAHLGFGPTFALDGSAVVFASETDGVNELYASLFRRGARAGPTPAAE